MPRYEFIVLSVPLAMSWADRTPTAHTETLLRTLSQVLPALAQQLDEQDGGGWEAFSHDLLRLDDGVLITVLARRETRDSASS